MSYTELYNIDKKGDVKQFIELENAFRGAMSIWMRLEEKYLEPLPPTYERTVSTAVKKNHRVFDMIGIREIWALFYDEKVSRADKIVLGSTFDGVIVLKENFSELLEAMTAFIKECNTTSLDEQIKVIKKLDKKEDSIGICWNQTSVNGGNWEERYDEKDNPIPYNININIDHWNLFNEEMLK